MKKERLDGKLYEIIDERPIKGKIFDGSRIDFVYKLTSIWDDFGYIWEIWQMHTVDGRILIRAYNTESL